MICRILVVMTLWLGVQACASDQANPQGVSDAALSERLAGIDRTLALGMQGDDVATVHAYLTRYGYFPNARLQHQYPSWRAIVSEAPANDAVFDAQTQRAVRALQANAALTPSGVIDGASLALMRSARCGTPDGIEPLDPADKFAVGFGSRWTSSTVTWRLENTNDVTQVQAEAAIAAALASWAAQTTLTFTKLTSGTADIEIKFQAGVGSDFAAVVSAGPPNGDMVINSDFSWSVATPTPAGSYDLQSVVLHELGHSLGIAHSSVLGPTINDDATMYPFARAGMDIGKQDRTLAADDKIAVSALYDTLISLPGTALDVAIGAGGAVWSIGTACAFGGCSIQKWNGSGWDTADSVANQIAVDPSGVPYIVFPTGALYKRTGTSATSGSWQQFSTVCAHDVAIGANGELWILGCATGFGGYVVQKWNGASWDQSPDSVAIDIGIGPTGIPWIVSPTGAVLRHSTNNPLNGSWQQVGTSTDTASHISIDPDGFAWKLGVPANGNATLALWDEQAALAGSNGAPARAQWYPQGTAPVAAIAAGHQALWIVDTGHFIGKSAK